MPRGSLGMACSWKIGAAPKLRAFRLQGAGTDDPSHPFWTCVRYRCHAYLSVIISVLPRALLEYCQHRSHSAVRSSLSQPLGGSAALRYRLAHEICNTWDDCWADATWLSRVALSQVFSRLPAFTFNSSVDAPSHSIQALKEFEGCFSLIFRWG